MKIPKARKLPSGNWFVRVQVDGQTVSITQPTEKACIAEAVALKTGAREARTAAPGDKTVSAAIDEYIAARQNVLSPSTIRGYRIIQRNRFQGAMTARIGSITPQRWQTIVNAEAKMCSAKTLKNAWGFLGSVIREATGREVAVRLPQVVEAERPFLDQDQIRVFLRGIHGDSAETAALLALSSLRQSEILGLRWEDVDLKNGVIHVRGAAVPDEHNQLVRKAENKNQTSRRDVPIIAPLAEALREEPHRTGPVVTVGRWIIFRHINRVCRENDLPEVGIHGLRHSFASLAYELQIPEKVAMEIGGWSDDRTMRKIYTHIAERSRKNFGREFTRFFDVPEGKENENCNENCNEKLKA